MHVFLPGTAGNGQAKRNWGKARTYVSAYVALTQPLTQAVATSRAHARGRTSSVASMVDDLGRLLLANSSLSVHIFSELEAETI